MTLVETLRRIAPMLREQGRLIQLPEDRRAVFVGDTHGDLDATERVFKDFGEAGNVLVFLGDTVDRGADSAGNLQRILEEKLQRPDEVHLLMGNHEVWPACPFSPASFWESLDEEERSAVSALLEDLPYAAVHPAGLLSLHGGLPDLPSLEAFSSIEIGSDAWRDVTWADWGPEDGPMRWGCRPFLGEETFQRRADALGIRALVRSHQPDAPEFLFEDRCLTIFTSNAYGSGPRRVALLEPGRTVRSCRDLRIERIDR